MFIGDWMERGERYHPDALAVVDVHRGEDGRFTYRQMNARANRLARFLRDEAGIGRGDRVGVLAPNGVEVLDALFACAKLGAIFVPFNWRSSARELVEAVRLTEPKALLFADDFRAAAAEIAAAGTSVRTWIHAGGEGIEGSVDHRAIETAPPAAPISNEAVGEDDILCLLFTGGTTGLPKAARLSYRMVAWNTLNTIVHELARGDVTITHTPMFHTGGLFVHTVPLLTLGGTVVLLRKWTAESMLGLIEQEKVTVLFCVPTQFQRMMAEPTFETTSLRSLRFLISGGAPLPTQVIDAYREAHGVLFKQGFGMTEFGPNAFVFPPEYAKIKAGSIGKPSFFVDARIAGEDGRALPPGEIGELWLKGSMAFSGYHCNEEATREALDPDGWLHTGDLARADEDGFFFIAGRKKDMFISGGENVYPVEVERALHEHPAVAQCAVVGVPDADWGEVGKAVVVLKPGTTASERELLDHCRARLARYKVPKIVVFASELPLSAAGKILKRELR